MSTSKRLFALLFLIMIFLSACMYKSEPTNHTSKEQDEVSELPANSADSNGYSNPESKSVSNEQTALSNEEQPEEQPPNEEVKLKEEEKKIGEMNRDTIQVVGNPQAIEVLVNKQNKLPDNYTPRDLVYPNVKFIFSEKTEKRKMRKEAAKALEKMFSVAEKDGIHLAGASGYRSQKTQEILYNSYVSKDGQEAADRYSAKPGHSEHQTGLSIDVSGANGKCAVKDCFGGTPESNWLAEHAYEYGFIIRYPKGKEQITGYQYEPWHIRYVGLQIASEIHEKNITLEEYFNVAIPVDGKK